MLQSNCKKVFYGINLILVCIFAAFLLLMNRAVPDSERVEYFLMLALLIVFFVIGEALNCALYAVRRRK